MLNQHRSLIESGHVRIHTRCEHIGEHAERRAVALHPSPESRMTIAVRVRQDVTRELLIHSGSALWFGGQRLTNLYSHVFGNRLPGGLVAHSLKVIEHIVEHSVTEPAELIPITRIECLIQFFVRHIVWDLRRKQGGNLSESCAEVLDSK